MPAIYFKGCAIRVHPCCQGAYSMIMVLDEATNGHKIIICQKSGHH